MMKTVKWEEKLCKLIIFICNENKNNLNALMYLD